MDVNQLIEELKKLEIDDAKLAPLIARLQTEGLTEDVKIQLDALLAEEEKINIAAVEILNQTEQTLATAKAGSDAIEQEEDQAVNNLTQQLSNEVTALEQTPPPTAGVNIPVNGVTTPPAELTNQAVAPVAAPVEPIPAPIPAPVEQPVTPTMPAAVAPTPAATPAPATAPAGDADWLKLLDELEQPAPPSVPTPVPAPVEQPVAQPPPATPSASDGGQAAPAVPASATAAPATPLTTPQG